MDPFTLALITGGLSAAGSIGSGFLGRKKGRETREQKRDRNIIDLLMQGINGQGPYASIFSADEDTFNRLYRDPAASRFKNFTSPSIQQQFIGSGQHLGTGMEDELTRAGVDMDTILNQQYGQFQQDAQNRQLDTLSLILGNRTGVEPRQSYGDAFRSSVAGYLSGPGFQKDLLGLSSGYKERNALRQQGNDLPPGTIR